uniref:Uncharacterized protein n=1 Tax=Globodera rostochiensis TaxID=31243 RepID=A0A914I6G7_GLORO
MILSPLISFCCSLIMLRIIKAKEPKQNDVTAANGTNFAQQSPRLRLADERPSFTNELQNTQLFRSARNSLRFRAASMPSNEDRTQDEVVRLKNVAKEVEEKLGLSPPRLNSNRQGPTLIGPKRGELIPAIESPGLSLRRLIAVGDGAGGLPRTRPTNPLFAATLLRQQQRESAQTAKFGINPVVGSNFIGKQQQLSEQQQRMVQQQQFQTLFQQLATIQQQRQLQQLLLNNQWQNAAERNERLGASRASSTFSGNVENLAPPGFFGAGSGQTSVALPGKLALTGIRSVGQPPAATASFLGGIQPIQPPPIAPPLQSSSTDLADLTALLQKMSLNNPTNPSSSSTVLGPIAAVLPNAASPQVTPQQERPVVVKLVTAGSEQQQQNTNNNNNVALQQIVLQEQQRFVELLEREQYREQLVQNNRKELQAVQDQQQRILELLDAFEREKEQLEDNSRAIRRTALERNKAIAADSATSAPTQQQSSADTNLLKGLLQAFSNIITPQGTPSGTASSSTSGQPLPNIGPNLGGQVSQFLNQLLQQPSTTVDQSQLLVKIPQQQQQQKQAQAVQQPAVQYVSLYDPRVGQQQQFDAASLLVGGDGTVSSGLVQPQQQVGAVFQPQQQVGAVPQLPQQVGAVPQLPQQVAAVSQQQVGAVPQQQVGVVPLLPQQVGAVPPSGWLPVGDVLSGGNNGQQQLLANGIVQRAQQRQRQDVQQPTADGTAANGQTVDEDNVEEVGEEEKEAGLEDGRWTASADGGGGLDDE